MPGIEVDYRDLAELLDRSNAPFKLAEVHGGLCGVICSSGRAAASRWLDGLLDDCAGDSDTLSELAVQLEGLGSETWHALTGFSMEFCPLLPDDDEDIDQRAEALGLWCHGFLSGLVVGGVDVGAGTEILSTHLVEVVQDFAEISKAGADPAEIEDPNLGENSLFELVEFVRVGTQFAFEELIPDARSIRTIH